MIARNLLSPVELAQEFGIPATLQKRLRERRELAFVKLGHRSVYYKRTDIERFLEAHRVAAIGEGR